MYCIIQNRFSKNLAIDGEGAVGLEDSAACRRRGAEVDDRPYGRGLRDGVCRLADGAAPQCHGVGVETDAIAADRRL